MIRPVLIAAIALLIALPSQAEEIKYRPVNPAFGGNPFNGPYLLSNATAQRQQSAPKKKRDPLEEFSENIQRGLLSRISREIADQILGEDARESGSFSVGGQTIDFKRQGDQVIIDITDPKSGGQTTIELPVPVL